MFRKTSPTGEKYHQKHWNRKHSAEGQDVWESCSFAPHRDAQGRIVGIGKVSREREEAFWPSIC
jgi:hypothetical protein